MATCVRTASLEDLDALATLTSRHRQRLAEWVPRWWAPADDADELHALWIRYLVEDDRSEVLVVEQDGVAVGCAVQMPQPAQWFVDDFALADEHRWNDHGMSLVDAISKRPVLTCVATADHARAEFFAAHGLSRVSSYWMHATERSEVEVGPAFAGSDLRAAPPHTFGGPFDAGAVGALSFTNGSGEIVVGSPSIIAPPVYDPGGAVCVVDRIVGSDRAALVGKALAVAGNRGDVLLNVVAAVDDLELGRVLDETGFDRTVEVYQWP